MYLMLPRITAGTWWDQYGERKMEKSTFCFGLETVRTVIWCLVQNPWPVSYTLNWEVKLDITNLLYIRGGEKWWVKPFPVLHVAFEAFLLSREFGKIYSWLPLTYRSCLPCPSGALENVALPSSPRPVSPVSLSLWYWSAYGLCLVTYSQYTHRCKYFFSWLTVASWC